MPYGSFWEGAIQINRRYDLKHVLTGVLLYFLSIYMIPFILVFLLASESIMLVEYEELISIAISLVILFLIGVLTSRKNEKHVLNVLLIGAVVLIFSVLGLLGDFSVVNLIHDIFIIPVMLLGHFLNKLMSGVKK